LRRGVVGDAQVNSSALDQHDAAVKCESASPAVDTLHRPLRVADDDLIPAERPLSRMSAR
jgi:hypothetical protein